MKQAKDAGDVGIGEVYNNLAAQQDMLMSLFGETKDNSQENN